MITRAVTLMLPRALAHPIETVTKSAEHEGRNAGASVSATTADLSKKARKAARTARKRMA